MLAPYGDIEKRLKKTGFLWHFLDERGESVAFGTLDIVFMYPTNNEMLKHLYIPLLAVRADQSGKGYGKEVVQFLINEATIWRYMLEVTIQELQVPFSDHLYLDVYTNNAPAVGLYQKCGFQIIEPEPRLDELNNNAPYYVMARRIAIAPAPAPAS
ncbi:MAG: GNAT family N-acetyltransferase [Gemmataceae bacterium]